MALTVHDESFEVYLTQDQIAARVTELGRDISRDFAGRDPFFIGVLTGGFIFMADLIRAVKEPVSLDFIKLSSYGDGLSSQGRVHQALDLTADIAGRHVIVVEDIIDTGLSMKHIISYLEERRPASVTLATLLHKPAATRHPLDIKYIGFTIPNQFVIGYGLDYAQSGRNLPHIYIRR